MTILVSRSTSDSRPIVPLQFQLSIRSLVKTVDKDINKYVAVARRLPDFRLDFSDHVRGSIELATLLYSLGAGEAEYGETDLSLRVTGRKASRVRPSIKTKSS